VDFGLNGRVALVAGASSGLGLAVARELLAEGARVSIASRSAERIAQARESLDGEVLAVEADMRDDAAVRDWVEQTAATFGGIDIVVANAGGPPAGTATSFDLDGYRGALELNLLSSIRLVHAALPYVRRSDQGRVLFVTSITVKQPVPALALSNTARAGVVGYAKSLVHELGDAGVTVNVLAPGYTRTARLEQLAGDDVDASLAAMAADVPLGRVGEPHEFAAVATFLASSRASFITGTVLLVDGGQHRGLL
jgi:3-oxoacyl-[acyl-carrier protein] reductase